VDFLEFINLCDEKVLGPDFTVYQDDSEIIAEWHSHDWNTTISLNPVEGCRRPYFHASNLITLSYVDGFVDLSESGVDEVSALVSKLSKL
jgi:hypothetical protein